MHNHHRRCGHARGELEDYVRHAIELGIEVLGVSDHAPLFASHDDHPKPRVQMARSEFPGYLHEATTLRDRYAGELEVRIGVEADYVEGTESVYRDALARPELDYVIGSVHDFGPFHVYHPETWPPPGAREDLFTQYFRQVRLAAACGLFDVLGHFDAVKVFGPEVFEVVPHEIDATLEAIAASGIVVEINTAGLRKCGEVFPRPDLIRRLADRGVAFTFGSDAHVPEELAFGATQVLAICEEARIDRFAVFSARSRGWVPRHPTTGS